MTVADIMTPKRRLDAAGHATWSDHRADVGRLHQRRAGDGS